MKKSRIDQLVCDRLQGDVAVSTITRVFLEVVAEQLAAGKEVSLGGFGIFHAAKERASPYVRLTSVKGVAGKVKLGHKIRVHFRKGALLKRLLDTAHGPGGTHMDKYAVDEEEQDGVKLSNDGCPECGCPANKLEKHGSVVLCPRCGSEPFEKKANKKR